MYESGAQKSCIQKTNAIFSIHEMSEQQKLGKIQKAKKFCNQIEMKINNNIFLEWCSGRSKSGDFWKTVKPFFSKKGSSGEQKNVLNESDKIVNDQKEVANHFKNCFSTVAEKRYC